MIFNKKEFVKIYADDLSTISVLIASRKNFSIWGVSIDETFKLCKMLEKMIEFQGLTSRIYTRGRISAVGLGGALSIALGTVIIASIITHNILTLNPNYEICRDLANNRILVSLKK